MPNTHAPHATRRGDHNAAPDQSKLGRRLHKVLVPVPSLKDPIDPALLEHDRERAEAAQNRVADRITAFVPVQSPVTNQ